MKKFRMFTGYTKFINDVFVAEVRNQILKTERNEDKQLTYVEFTNGETHSLRYDNLGRFISRSSSRNYFEKLTYYGDSDRIKSYVNSEGISWENPPEK